MSSTMIDALLPANPLPRAAEPSGVERDRGGEFAPVLNRALQADRPAGAEEAADEDVDERAVDQLAAEAIGINDAGGDGATLDENSANDAEATSGANEEEASKSEDDDATGDEIDEGDDEAQVALAEASVADAAHTTMPVTSHILSSTDAAAGDRAEAANSKTAGADGDKTSDISTEPRNGKRGRRIELGDAVTDVDDADAKAHGALKKDAKRAAAAESADPAASDDVDAHHASPKRRARAAAESTEPKRGTSVEDGEANLTEDAGVANAASESDAAANDEAHADDGHSDDASADRGRRSLDEAASVAASRRAEAALPSVTDVGQPVAPIVATGLDAISDVDRDAEAGETAPVDATSSKRDAAAVVRLAAERSLHAPTAGDGEDALSGPERTRFVGRVEGAIRAAQQRDGRVQVRLSPPELGALRIELTVHQGALSARLEAETPAARNLLLDNLPALRERLAQQDVRVERFDVDLRQDSTGSGGSSQNGAQDRPAREADWRHGPHRGERPRATAVASAPARGSAAPGSESALDVRV